MGTRLIAEDFLNLAAHALLRICSPSTTHAVLQRAGDFLPRRRTREELRWAALNMKQRGTCLTRALALAARSPRAEVVIGVHYDERDLRAHAWVELDGGPLDPSHPSGREIARLGGAIR